jgi:DNA mismatch repair protein PMS2
MATIKPIEARSVHQIQSGQVIVDLCSVVKELVENSLDAGATSLEVRFKNNGLDSIEVQDNGSGISPSDYESLALKHYTSKLASYDDLSSLQTFGFRGEALSSLSALSTFYVITAMADEAPKGKRLDFDSSGKLKNVAVVAAQKGMTAVVEGLFVQLPVRRKELTKNIKREYGKVLGLLHAYACISTNVKFTVKSAMAKGKNATVFATKANPTTRENIANVYGAKTLTALVALELQLDLQRLLSEKKDTDNSANNIVVRGHISRPVFGEGRQTPDRQMFFVNGRPCGLPQIAKAFNEVYKSFNVSQSPFIFADLEMDTNAYDVNISPDKRTIMLHDSATLVETLKSSLAELFDRQEQTVPQSRVQIFHLPAYKQLTITRESTGESTDNNRSDGAPASAKNSLNQDEDSGGPSFLHDFFRNQASRREGPKAEISDNPKPTSKKKLAKALEAEASNAHRFDEYGNIAQSRDMDKVPEQEGAEQVEDIHVRDFNQRIAEQEIKAADQQCIPASPTKQIAVPSPAASISHTRTNAVQNAFDRIRPPRPAAEMATITVGDKTITTRIGTPSHSPNSARINTTVKHSKTRSSVPASTQAFTRRLEGFAAPGTPSAQTNAESSLESELSDGSQDVTPDPEGFVKENVSPDALAEADDDDAESDDVDLVDSPKHDIDGEYIDETEKKAREVATVAGLIRAAEEKAASLNVKNPRRANKVFQTGSHKDSTTSLQITIPIGIDQVYELASYWQLITENLPGVLNNEDGAEHRGNDEERLALTVSKHDFSNMHIVGQFNLGFILSVRSRSDAKLGDSDSRNADELFIVDQHASDEKYNFEKLQDETVVGNQRLVRPKQLELTAVEEEILIENSFALEKNGFLVAIDTEEDEPIGQRCKLISLPLSKEVTFGLEDLEELLHLLAESPGLSQSSIVPRPSKVRKMFAMRACRSSIMIGKPLTEIQMRTVVFHMGQIDKPWNCPHGRPTMRHLMSLNSLETWQEGDGISGKPVAASAPDTSVWSRYAEE